MAVTEPTMEAIRRLVERAVKQNVTAADAFAEAAKDLKPAQVTALAPAWRQAIREWNAANPKTPIQGGLLASDLAGTTEAAEARLKPLPRKKPPKRTPEVAARAAPAAKAAAVGGSLGAMSWAKLVSMAKKKGIEGAGKMTKPQLLAALAGKPAAKAAAAPVVKATAKPAVEAEGKAAAGRFAAAARPARWQKARAKIKGRAAAPAAAAKETVARGGTMRGHVVGPGKPLGKGVLGLTRKHAARRAVKKLATKGAKGPKVPMGGMSKLLHMIGPYLLLRQAIEAGWEIPGQEKLAGMQMEAQAAGQPSAEDIVQQAMLQDITAQRQTQLGGPGGMNPEMMQAIQAQQMMQQRQMQMQKLQQQLTQNEIMLPGPGQQQAPMMGGAGPVGPGGITPQRIFGLA